ncbi:Ger(x)C family spore germination protein [Paenibacillus rigui]|uniref:Spore gernimation protein GerC n=1 Tax=Paenibacillus rigui TaxID=554312 RepID=A0A229UK74_9BACL|nr:Ger(x)C family spore germination protein [Paenibacillus rigui]OXM83793.1 spore gernimation protein GerC [Paenibacillus rigui]
MKKLITLIAGSLLILTLTGCWNSKDIQTMAYVTALGLDYQDGKYISYVQVLNFSNVAKTEGAELGRNIPNWIGRGEGKTVTESFNAIYATSQIRVFWGHVKAIVCTENLLKDVERIKEAYDIVNRYREVRYNVLLYGTKLPLEQIFIQKSLLNFSPLDTMMYSPSQIFSQRSFILPIYGFKCIAHMNEPGSPGMLPTINIDTKGWTEDTKAKPMLRIDGAYFLSHGNLNGWLSEGDLRGYRWLQKKLERSPIQIMEGQRALAALVLLHPKPKIETFFQNGKAFFNVSLKIEAYVDELTEDVPEKELEKRASKILNEEIRYSYKKGLDIHSDIYRLDQALYRNYPKQWHELHEHKDFILDEASLKQIQVKVHLLHTGKYKGRVE